MDQSGLRVGPEWIRVGSGWAADQTDKRLGLKWFGQLSNGKCSCSRDNFSKSKVGQSNTKRSPPNTPHLICRLVIHTAGGAGDMELKQI